MDDAPQTNEKEVFLDMMVELTFFLASLQEEISVVLAQNEKVRRETEALIKRPDHEIVAALDNAVNRFLLAMPLASLYGVNLIMNVIEHHSNITGNRTITEVCNKVREKMQTYQYN